MWVALIKLTSFLGRVAAFSFSVVALALISLTLSQRDWMDGISIYIVVVGCISILAALIPPYPNFLIDGLFAAAWIIAAAFSFLVMFLKSTCYGVANGDPSEAVACPKYKALVAMSFLSFFAWGGCAALGLLLFFIAIFKNARLRSNRNLLEPTIYREQYRTTEERPASVITVPEGAKIAVDDKKAYPDEKTAYPVEKKAYPSEKKGDDKITPVAAPIIVADTSYVEEEYAPQEPEYMRVSGLLGDFILANWLWLGILGLIVVAVIIPILVVYAIPAFAYYIADNIEVPENVYGSITSFKEDHATFDVISTIRAPDAISATLDPMTLMMFIPDTLPHPIPVAYVHTTKIKIKGGQTFTVYNQSITIGNLTEWGRLWRLFAFQDTMDIGVMGKATMHAGPFKTTLNLMKTKTFQGLLNATDVQLEYLRLQPPDEDGCNIVVSVPVVNPSPLTVNSDASAVANVLIGDTVLGEARVDGFSLVKGKGIVKARAKIDFQNILALFGNIGQILGIELPALLKHGMVIATVQAASISDGGHTWPYWVAAAQAVKLSAAVEIEPVIGTLLSDVVGGALSGNGGALLSLNNLTSVIDVNVTVINKVLKNLTIVDAETLT